MVHQGAGVEVLQATAGRAAVQIGLRVHSTVSYNREEIANELRVAANEQREQPVHLQGTVRVNLQFPGFRIPVTLAFDSPVAQLATPAEKLASFLTNLKDARADARAAANQDEDGIDPDEAALLLAPTIFEDSFPEFPAAEFEEEPED